MRKSIPTEYREIVFDSKSEAVFARTLDLSGAEWKYHPPEHGNHRWDFLVASSTRPDKPTLIEYKPAMPTNTYVDNLVMKMSVDPRESIVVWGNPWEGIDKSIDGPQECCYRVYPIYCSHGKYGWGDFIRLGDNGGDWPTSTRHQTWAVLGITEEMVQEAMRYRFDLA
ncbi:hypothetical protein [Desulfoluna spongiiphila]|uniref:Uncharacterized protein n=1 Tax=Desulfoluna spongiiphila TaxID=419481 RepID=A0A1G5ADU1_9BACT|nr:hypothetical protein [Desulfoluna spongiiphila]SCX76025.1 hypothetical protein SAMN05216233_10186 [Desulfoluna spongiiphila]